MDEYETLALAFSRAKAEAASFADAYNATLPSAACPACGIDSHLPGLKCPTCGYRHDKCWLIVRDTDFGYDVGPILNRRIVVARFNVA